MHGASGAKNIYVCFCYAGAIFGISVVTCFALPLSYVILPKLGNCDKPALPSELHELLRI